MASSRLFVGNLPFTVTENELEAILAGMGEIYSVRLVKDKSGNSRGFGFVEVADPEQVIAALDEKNCQECTLVVKYAVDRGGW